MRGDGGVLDEPEAGEAALSACGRRGEEPVGVEDEGLLQSAASKAVGSRRRGTYKFARAVRK